MIVFPEGFVKTKYEGYFWHVPTQHLYSIKIGGVLKALKLHQPWTIGYQYTNGGNVLPLGFSVSVNGRKKRYALEDLKKLKATDKVEVIPVTGQLDLV